MTNDISTYKCLKGHESTESDYCSECGVKILGTGEQPRVTNAIASPTPQNITLETCPACSVNREPNSGDFCEICGYNFVTGAHGEVPIAIERIGGVGEWGTGRTRGTRK